MSQAVCTKCGSELLPGTSFCRQCGQPATETAPSSEQVTAIFGGSPEAATTQRLDPRPTVPAYEVNSPSLASASAPLPAASAWTKRITIGIVVAVMILVSIGVMWAFKARNRAASNLQVSRSLVYPGARTVVDFGDSGGAVLQLETRDALDKVRDWYDVTLKPTKTLRVTSTSVIQKKENVTVTLVTEEQVTSIVIKQNR